MNKTLSSQKHEKHNETCQACTNIVAQSIKASARKEAKCTKKNVTHAMKTGKPAKPFRKHSREDNRKQAAHTEARRKASTKIKMCKKHEGHKPRRCVLLLLLLLGWGGGRS